MYSVVYLAGLEIENEQLDSVKVMYLVLAGV